MTNVLFFLAKTFEHPFTRPLNEFVRLCIKACYPLLLKMLCGGTWIIRHSASHRSEYNVFYSDIDFALIVNQKNQNDTYVANTLNKYFCLQRIILNLGEVEIYSSEEWRSKLELTDLNKDVITLSRAFRKLGWIKKSFKTRQNSYHKSKDLRAAKKCRRQICENRKNIWQLVNNELPYALPYHCKIHSYFYDYHIFSGINKNETKNKFLLVTSVNTYPYELSYTLRAKLRFPIIKMEKLEFRAYLRFKNRLWNIEDPWLNQITNEISTFPNMSLGHFQFPKRMQLHLEDKFTISQFEKEIQEEEDQILKSDALLCDEIEVFNWIQSHIPQSHAEYIKLTPVLRSQIFSCGDQKNQNTVTFYGPTTLRFGIMNFLSLIKFQHAMGYKDFTYRLVGYSETDNCKDGLKKFILNMHGYDAQVEISKEPAGVIVCPFFYDLKEERNWLYAAKSFDLPVLNGTHIPQLHKLIVNQLSIHH